MKRFHVAILTTGLALVACAAIILPRSAAAQNAILGGNYVQCTSSITSSDTPEVGLNCDLCDLLALINAVTTYAVGFLGFISSFMIFVSGYLYLTSAGDEHRIGQAKQTLRFSIIGFVIAVLSGIIVKTVVVQLFVPQGSRPGSTAAFGVWNCSDISLPEPSAPTPGAGGSTTQPPPEPGVPPPPGETGKLTDEEARKRLTEAGVSISPSANCNGVQTRTISEAINFQQNVCSNVHINSCTEGIHGENFTYSHANGWKLDYALNSSLNNCVQRKFECVGVKPGTNGERWPMWADDSGNLYTWEHYGTGKAEHWDVLYHGGATSNNLIPGTENECPPKP